MLHRCDGAVVCDIVGHVVGDRLPRAWRCPWRQPSRPQRACPGRCPNRQSQKCARCQRGPDTPALAPRPRPCRYLWGSARDLFAGLAWKSGGKRISRSIRHRRSEPHTRPPASGTRPSTQRSGGTHLASRRTVTRPGGRRDEPLDLRKLLGDDAADVLSLRHHTVHLEEAVVAAAIANRGDVNARILQPLRE